MRPDISATMRKLLVIGLLFTALNTYSGHEHPLMEKRTLPSLRSTEDKDPELIFQSEGISSSLKKKLSQTHSEFERTMNDIMEVLDANFEDANFYPSIEKTTKVIDD